MFDSNAAFSNQPYSWGFFPTLACCIVYLVSVIHFEKPVHAFIWNFERITGRLTSLHWLPGCLWPDVRLWIFFYSFRPLNVWHPPHLLPLVVQKGQIQRLGSPCVLHTLWNSLSLAFLSTTEFKSLLVNYFFSCTVCPTLINSTEGVCSFCNYSFNYFNMQIVTLWSTGFGL